MRKCVNSEARACGAADDRVRQRGPVRMRSGVDVEMFATEDLDEARRSAVIDLCVAAHDNEEFRKIFSHYIALPVTW